MTIRINGSIVRRPLVNGIRAADEISTDTIKHQLDQYPRGHVVPVEIDSAGGHAVECERIQKMLVRHHSPIDITIGALAAGGAAWIALASRNVMIRENGKLQLSMPWISDVGGDATALRREADKLDRIADGAAETIARERRRRGRDIDVYYLLDLMLAETWFTPIEAVKAGLVDDIIAAEVTA